MDDTVTVEIVESLDQLLGNLTHLRFSQVAVVFENFEELSLGEFCDDTELVRGFERIQKQDDILVIQTLENFNFLAQVVHFFLCFASKFQINYSLILEIFESSTAHTF